jgi:hypothetical protein
MSGARFDHIYGDAELLLLLDLACVESTSSAQTSSSDLEAMPGVEVLLQMRCASKISARLEVAASEDVAAGSVGAWAVEIAQTDDGQGNQGPTVQSIEMPSEVSTKARQVTVSTVKDVTVGSYTVRAMHKRLSGTSQVQTEAAVLTVKAHANEVPPCNGSS